MKLELVGSADGDGVVGPGVHLPGQECSIELRFRACSLNSTPYLDPEEPPFLGFLIMISLYMSLDR